MFPRLRRSLRSSVANSERTAVKERAAVGQPETQIQSGISSEPGIWFGPCFLSTSRSRANKSNFSQPDEDRPAIRNRRRQGTDTFFTLPTEPDQIFVPCRVNRTFRLFEKLKISQQPNRRSGAQLSQLVPARFLTRSADVISPDTTVPPGYLAFCLPTRPSTEAWVHISKIHRVLRGQHPASSFLSVHAFSSLLSALSSPPRFHLRAGNDPRLRHPARRRDDARPAR
jgi:hypothetical protein